MEQLAKYLGLLYRYTDRHEVWLSNQVPTKMLQNYQSYWRLQLADVVAMKARRLNMLTELMGMGLIDEKQARKMVGLGPLDEV